MFVFWILAILILVSALAVVTLPNPLHSALCLATNLVCVAGLYALLGAHFLAAVQIIVYAGAIMVLVVFVLMLLNAKRETRTIADLIFSLIAFFAVILSAILVFPLIHKEFAGKLILSSSPEAGSFAGVTAIGQRLFSDQALLFQLTGVILITAIVGAVMLATQRRASRINFVSRESLTNSGEN